MADLRSPDPVTVIFTGLTGAAALLVVIMVATALFGTGEDDRLDGKALVGISEDATALRAEQATLLEGYRPLKGGRVAIPISRAMEVVLPELQAAEVPAVEEPAATE